MKPQVPINRAFSNLLRGRLNRRYHIPHLDSGLDRDWLWEDWQDALTGTEVDDCRWTPCFDCGVCPQMGTQIEVGPTGKTLLPLTILGSGRERMAEHTHA